MADPKVYSVEPVPEIAISRSRLSRHDYIDTFRIHMPRELAKDLDGYLWHTSICWPFWVSWLMLFRNWLVKFVGINTEVPELLKEPKVYEIGEVAGMFTLLWRDEGEILLGEQEKHLDFEAHVYYGNLDDDPYIDFTTLVHLKNNLGRLYFFFVKPLHKIVVKALLKKAGKQMILKMNEK